MKSIQKSGHADILHTDFYCLYFHYRKCTNNKQKGPIRFAKIFLKEHWFNNLKQVFEEENIE